MTVNLLACIFVKLKESCDCYVKGSLMYTFYVVDKFGYVKNYIYADSLKEAKEYLKLYFPRSFRVEY